MAIQCPFRPYVIANEEGEIFEVRYEKSSEKFDPKNKHYVTPLLATFIEDKLGIEKIMEEKTLKEIVFTGKPSTLKITKK